jgi:FdhD protein
MARQTLETSVVRYRGSGTTRADDSVATEDPLEIRLADRALAVTMRTPGEDADLVLGFLLTEGILLAPDEVERIDKIDASRVNVQLRADVTVDTDRFQRNMFVSSSCGVCGKASIEAVTLLARPTADFEIPSDVVAHLSSRLREHQPTFDSTGGLHAAGLFDLTGDPLVVREDVGRHNAVDKAIGAAVTATWPLPRCLLVVSGRQSFEIVQKAAMVGIGGIVGVSAPSSLAVQLARSLNLLLVGFARERSFNVYSGEHHLV